jgi:hypothetical protein
VRVSPIQEAFTAGFLGERVRGRVSTDTYGKGLAECKNWHPLIQGPVRLREGTKYVTPVADSNWISGDLASAGIRVFTFEGGLDNDYIVEIGSGEINVRNAATGAGGALGGTVVGGTSEELVPDNEYVTGVGPIWVHDTRRHGYQCGGDNCTPITDGSGNILQGAVTGPFQQGTPDAYFTLTGVYQQYSILVTLREVVMGSLQNSSAAPIEVPAAAELLQNTLNFRYRVRFPQAIIDEYGPVPISSFTLRFEVGTTPGGNDIINQTQNITTLDTWVNTEFQFVPGAGNNNLYLSFGIAFDGAFNGAINENYFLDVGKISMISPLSGGSGTPVQFTSPWTKQQLERVLTAADPGEKVMFFFHPNVEPYRLRLLTNQEWEFQAISTITSPSNYTPPSPNVWTGENWPGCGVFHEGRLWVAGSPNEPSTIWASRSGNYQDFDGTTPNAKDDPLLFPLSTRGNIVTLSSRKDLVVNTDISEVIGTADVGPIAFDDFDFPKQTDWGGAPVQPIVAGRQMIYTSNIRRKIRTFADEGGTNYGWDGQELSLLAEELFGTPVRRMVFLDEPSYQVCLLLSDGTMACATYYYPEEVIGWWKFELAFNGSAQQQKNNIIDITKVNTSTGAKLWMVVNRVGFPGTLKAQHELLSFDSGLLPALDSFASRTIDPNSGICGDIDHLTDQDIDIVVEQVDTDGNIYYTVHPPGVQVVAGVTTPLEDWAWGGIAYLGHFFDNRFKLLPIESGSQRGTSQVQKRRWNKIYLRLSRSAIPLVEGEYSEDRTPSTPMGYGEPITSNDIEYAELGSGKGDLLITQDRPLKTEVTAIFGKLVGKEV